MAIDADIEPLKEFVKAAIQKDDPKALGEAYTAFEAYVGSQQVNVGAALSVLLQLTEFCGISYPEYLQRGRENLFKILREKNNIELTEEESKNVMLMMARQADNFIHNVTEDVKQGLSKFFQTAISKLPVDFLANKVTLDGVEVSGMMLPAYLADIYHMDELVIDAQLNLKGDIDIFSTVRLCQELLNLLDDMSGNNPNYFTKKVMTNKILLLSQLIQDINPDILANIYPEALFEDLKARSLLESPGILESSPLAIMKSLADKMNDTDWIDSEIKKGFTDGVNGVEKRRVALEHSVIEKVKIDTQSRAADNDVKRRRGLRRMIVRKAIDPQGNAIDADSLKEQVKLIARTANFSNTHKRHMVGREGGVASYIEEIPTIQVKSLKMEDNENFDFMVIGDFPRTPIDDRPIVIKMLGTEGDCKKQVGDFVDEALANDSIVVAFNYKLSARPTENEIIEQSKQLTKHVINNIAGGDPSRVTLHGHSLGAAPAVITAAALKDDNIKVGVVHDRGFSKLANAPTNVRLARKILSGLLKLKHLSLNCEKAWRRLDPEQKLMLVCEKDEMAKSNRLPDKDKIYIEASEDVDQSATISGYPVDQDDIHHLARLKSMKQGDQIVETMMYDFARRKPRKLVSPEEKLQEIKNAIASTIREAQGPERADATSRAMRQAEQSWDEYVEQSGMSIEDEMRVACSAGLEAFNAALQGDRDAGVAIDITEAETKSARNPQNPIVLVSKHVFGRICGQSPGMEAYQSLKDVLSQSDFNPLDSQTQETILQSIQTIAFSNGIFKDTYGSYFEAHRNALIEQGKTEGEALDRSQQFMLEFISFQVLNSMLSKENLQLATNLKLTVNHKNLHPELKQAFGDTYDHSTSPTAQASSAEAAPPAQAGAGDYAPLPKAPPEVPTSANRGAREYAPLPKAPAEVPTPASPGASEYSRIGAVAPKGAEADQSPQVTKSQVLKKQEADILAILNRDVGGFSRSAQQRQERKADVDLRNKRELEERAPNLGVDIYGRMDATDSEWEIAENLALAAQNKDFKIDHDEAHGLNHSFIKAGGNLLCIERGVRLGAGVEGQTKLAYDKAHNPYAVKVIQKADGSKDYQVMPYAGVRLSDLAGLSASEKMKILPKIMESLQAIHDKNIIHFDLNENNILVSVTPTGEYKVEIIDFGKSILLNENDVDGKVYPFRKNDLRVHDEVNMRLMPPETLPVMENDKGQWVPDVDAFLRTDRESLYVSKESDIYQLGKMLQTTFCADIPELNDLFAAMRSEVPEGRPSLDEIKLDFMLGTYESSQPTEPEQDAKAAPAIPAKGAQNYGAFPQKVTQAAAQAGPSSYRPMPKRDQPQLLDLAVPAVKAALESKNKGSTFEVSITGNAQDGFNITASCNGGPPREKMMTFQSLKSLVETYQRTLKGQDAGASAPETTASAEAAKPAASVVPGFSHQQQQQRDESKRAAEPGAEEAPRVEQGKARPR